MLSDSVYTQNGGATPGHYHRPWKSERASSRFLSIRRQLQVELMSGPPWLSELDPAGATTWRGAAT